MINKNELRFGNLVVLPHQPNKPIYPILEIRELGVIVGKSYEIGTAYCEFKVADPIPLTPEWLERLGFKKQMYSYYGDPKSEAVEAFVKERFVIRLINLIDRKGYRAEWIPYEQSQNGLPGWIDYVHQLQNKYYFWTDGEELTINNEHHQTTS